MDEELKNEILLRIDAISTKLGVASNYLWEVSVREVQITSIVSIIITVLLLIIPLIGISILVRKRSIALKKHEKGEFYYFIGKYGNDLSPIGGILLVLIITLIIGFFSTIFTLHSNISGIINPEFQAFQQILRSLK